jgi:hypothetical protein
MVVTSWTDTQIQAHTPPGVGLNLPIQVTNLVQQQGQSVAPNLFSYAAPFISGISPSSGDTPGGTLLTVFGQNFGASPGSITLGGNAMTIASWTETQIQVHMPAGVGLNHPVQVHTASGSSNLIQFNYNPPLISIVNPPFGPTAGGTLLTITGANFGAAPGNATLAGISMTVQSWSHSEVKAFTPPGIGSAQPVLIQTASGTSNVGVFHYEPEVILNVSPSTGPTNGGTILTISGTNFGPDAGSVTLASSLMTVQTWDNMEITAVTPPGVGLNQPIRVVTPSGPSNLGLFSYSAPQIQHMDTPTGPTSGGSTVTISGINFGAMPGNVTLAGNSMTVQSWTHDEVTALTPPGVGLSQQVRIQTASGLSNSGLFDYLPPSLSQVDPASGPTIGETLVTIDGENFGSSPGLALLGDSLVTIQSWNHTRIDALTPAGVGLNQPVRIQTASGNSNLGSFSYHGPTVSGISPSSGPLNGGTPITISGTNFGPFLGSATLNGFPMPVQSWTHTQVVALSPAYCGEDRPIMIETLSGVSNVQLFDYSPHHAAGDLTCDCTLDMDDIAPFVAALVNPGEFSGCDIMLADVNGDGSIDGLDISTFVERLLAS